MIVKVCGMRNPDNIRQVDALPGVDWMGFIFWQKSKRYVSEPPKDMPINKKRVGVFVDEDMEQVKRMAHEYALDIIQLHGHESPDYCQQLREWKVIKAFNIATPSDLESTKPYEDIADYFLFDTKGKSVGGNGEKFDWSVLNNYEGKTPFLLSGGIGSDDAERINAFHHPQLTGIDLNSGFETSPALKDPSLLRTFLSQLTH